MNSTFLAFNNLKNKKVRLVVTMLIMTIIFTSLGISVMLTDFNVNKTHAETMIREGQSKVIIRKKIPGENLTIDNPALTFTSNDIKEVNNKLAKEDSRIKIFSQPNHGQSVARNIGLVNSRGKYIYFFDSECSLYAICP